MKRITLDELEKTKKVSSYLELCAIVNSLIQEEKIKPVKASGTLEIPATNCAFIVL